MAGILQITFLEWKLSNFNYNSSEIHSLGPNYQYVKISTKPLFDPMMTQFTDTYELHLTILTYFSM